MPLLEKSDLQFKYSWTALTGDDPRVTGKPDSTLLNRGEGYEVLYFINRFSASHDFKQKSSGLKVEKLIKKHLPGDIRSHANVSSWLVANWKKFD